MHVAKLPPGLTISRLIVVSLLLLLVVMGAVPSYLNGNWDWKKPAITANLKEMRNLLGTGLTLSGWQTSKQVEARIGSYKWSIQLLEQDKQKPVTLLLRPQRSDLDKPEVDWVDIAGFEGWKTDSLQPLEFNTEGGAKVKARFFRARNQYRTLAVVQWYANPRGGNPNPSQWFWQDQLAQLRGERIPWVGVCLQIPVKPLGTFEDNLPFAQTLAQKVQQTLLETVFTDSVQSS